MRYIIPLSTVLLCMSSPFFAADTPTPNQTPPPQPYREGFTSQPKGLITPPVSPRVENGFDIVVDADFIWVKSQVSGLSFANDNGKTKSPPANFEPGFKVGLGMDLGFDGWDTYMEYTWESQPWLSSSFKNKKPLPANFIHADSHTGVLASPLVNNGTVSRKEQFNVLDLELGRNFFISRRLTLRPHFGFKLARMFEKTKIDETGTGAISNAHLFFQQTLSGAGTRAGLNTVWHLTKHFGLYGDIALTALWSSFHNNANMNITEDGKTIKRPLKERTQSILPVIETNVGVTYMLWFNDEQYQFYTKLGWQEDIWVDYNHNKINGMSNNSGILSIQGLDVKVGLAF